MAQKCWGVGDYQQYDGLTTYHRVCVPKIALPSSQQFYPLESEFSQLHIKKCVRPPTVPVQQCKTTTSNMSGLYWNEG